MKSFALAIVLFFTFFYSLAQEKTWDATYKIADSLMKKRNFKSAIPIYEEALNLAEKEFGKENEKYLMTRNIIGRCVSFEWKKEKSAPFLEENIILCKNFGVKTAVYGQALHNAGTFYMPSVKGNNKDLAKKYLSEAVELRKIILGDKHPDYATSLNNLALLYKEMSSYEAALPLDKEALAIRKEVLGDKHPDYASSLNNLANLYNMMGNYATALPLYKEALKIRKEVLGDKHIDYSYSLNNLALLYFYMGNYSAALPLNKEALAVVKEILGVKHPDYAYSLNNLADLYKNMGNYAAALPLHKEALTIRKEVFGNNHLNYAQSLNNLAIIYNNMGNFTAALLLYKEALAVNKEVLSKKHPYYAASLNNLASLYKDMGNYDAALPLFNEALAIQIEILGEKHPYYVTSLNNLANYNWLTNHKDKSFEERIFIKTWAIEQINLQFPTLSEQQKESFFNQKLKIFLNAYHAFSIEMPEVNTKDFCNTQLATKGILMQSALKMKSRILNSKDSTLINLYWTWTEQKNAIIKANEMSSNVRKEKGINLDSLLEQNEKIEQQLSKKSEAFKSLADKKQINWLDIKKKLNKGEAAIELIRINKFGVNKVVTDTSDMQKAPHFPQYPLYDLTDTVYYAALIIKKSSKQPEIVLLKNGSDLEQKFANYQKNMIVYKREDALSYNEFWKPIAANLSGISKVYLSPDGVYNQVSLNTLYNPTTKKYLLEELDLHLVTNTKDILAFGKKENKTLRAELLGYPIYDLANLNKNTNKTRGSEEDSLRAFTSFSQVALLPGTKIEVEDISKALTKNNFKVETLLAESATEENIKKVHNPKILHLSTHGFFIDSKEKNDKINPMLRSGLLLTGVTDYARMEEKPDTEDGVLTALEAANLDLDETDLVVLSACETGLGDVKAGEGVYGLQRAFKVAGAKTLVMSMWKVDDAVTQKLMSAFYQKYATTNNARLAFKEAQAEIKLAYPEPYYWGAFIMVGE